jgi:AcrR family transcriptional regulator
MPGKQNKLTFIEEARRKQLIGVTIQTIAENGFVNASLAEIAKRAEVSKGVIHYHFSNKDVLIRTTMDSILREIYQYIQEQVAQAGESASAQLTAYIKASFTYMAKHREAFVAQVDLWGSFASYEEKNRFNETVYIPCRRNLSKILEQGQDTNEFGEFSIMSMASIIQANIDGIMLQWVFDEDAIDLEESNQMIIELFLERLKK